MKNFKYFLLATIALIGGFALASCEPDPMDEGTRLQDAVVVNIEVGYIDQTTANFTIKTTGLKDFAWLRTDKTDIEATAILGGGEMVEIEDASIETTTDIKFENLDPSSTYTFYIAGHVVDGNLYEKVIKTDFSTTGFGQAITVMEEMYDGFKVHLTIPEEVKERGNGVRYSTASLAMYNYQVMRGFYCFDQLLTNAGQCTTKDKTIIYDDYHSVERDENGNEIYDEYGNYASAVFADPKTPGEPGIFIAGEFSWYTLQEYDPELGPGNDDTGPFGWGEGYFVPMYDYDAFYSIWNNDDFESADSEKFWTGYYERIAINCLPPSKLEGNVDIKVSGKTPINAVISFEPTDDVIMYVVMIVEENEMEANIMPLLNNNPDYLQWFTASAFGLYTFGSQTIIDGATDIYLSDWFVNTRNFAGQTFRVMVTGLGDNYGRTQCFNQTSFTLPEITLDAPEITVTAIKSTDPYSATFNIRNTSPDGQKLTEARFNCNYIREFNNILNPNNQTKYTYASLIESLGYKFNAQELQEINSTEGYTMTFSSRENATTRIAVMGWNWEGTPNDINATGSPAVCEYTTPRAPYRRRVNSPLFDELVGEWEATAPMIKYVASEDGTGGKYEEAGSMSSPVTISGGVEYPETLPEEVYDIYAAAGLSESQTNALYTEFKELAKDYNKRTRGFNRLLCVGYNFAPEDYMLNEVATPYDLFIDDEYGAAELSSLFYDFGPKWNLEIDEDGSVWLPLDIEREFPLETWNFGMEYTFYMLGVGMQSYIGAPVYNTNGEVVTDARFPVEISDDRNTITIKPIVYTDSKGTTETYYPCIAQLNTIGQAEPINPRIGGNVVLKRKSGAKTSSATLDMRGVSGEAKAVSSMGKTPVPMARCYMMTPMDINSIKVRKRHVIENPIEAGTEAFYKRGDKYLKDLYGIDVNK